MADVTALETAGLLERLGGDDWWTVVGLDSAGAKGAKPRVIVQAVGDGGLSAVKEHLKDDQVQFGAIRVMGVDPKGAVVSRRAKFIFFQWIGEGVPGMKRITATSAKSSVAAYFRGHHVALELNERDDLTEADLEKRLRAAGGAHQPDTFEFGSGCRVEVFGADAQPAAPAGAKPSPASSRIRSPAIPASPAGGAVGGAGAGASPRDIAPATSPVHAMSAEVAHREPVSQPQSMPTADPVPSPVPEVAPTASEADVGAGSEAEAAITAVLERVELAEDKPADEAPTEEAVVPEVPAEEAPAAADVEMEEADAAPADDAAPVEAAGAQEDAPAAQPEAACASPVVESAPQESDTAAEAAGEEDTRMTSPPPPSDPAEGGDE